MRKDVHLTHIRAIPFLTVLLSLFGLLLTHGSVLGFQASSGPSISELVHRYATKVGIDPQLVLAMAEVESGLNASAISPKGAVGVLQVLPTTAEDVVRRYGIQTSGVRMHRALLDPATNILIGVLYLKEQLDRFPTIELALAAYNAGPLAVTQHGGRIPPFRETVNYVARIRRRMLGSEARSFPPKSEYFLAPVSREHSLLEGSAPRPATGIEITQLAAGGGVAFAPVGRPTILEFYLSHYSASPGDTIVAELVTAMNYGESQHAYLIIHFKEHPSLSVGYTANPHTSIHLIRNDETQPVLEQSQEGMRVVAIYREKWQPGEIRRLKVAFRVNGEGTVRISPQVLVTAGDPTRVSTIEDGFLAEANRGAQRIIVMR